MCEMFSYHCWCWFTPSPSLSLNRGGQAETDHSERRDGGETRGEPAASEQTAGAEQRTWDPALQEPTGMILYALLILYTYAWLIIVDVIKSILLGRAFKINTSLIILFTINFLVVWWKWNSSWAANGHERCQHTTDSWGTCICSLHGGVMWLSCDLLACLAVQISDLQERFQDTSVMLKEAQEEITALKEISLQG